MSESPKLLDRVRAEIRARHYSRRTEEAYTLWIRRYILFHNKRHPSSMGGDEVNAFLTKLTVEDNVSASTQGAGVECAFVPLSRCPFRALAMAGGSRAGTPAGAAAGGADGRRSGRDSRAYERAVSFGRPASLRLRSSAPRSADVANQGCGFRSQADPRPRSEGTSGPDHDAPAFNARGFERTSRDGSRPTSTGSR